MSNPASRGSSYRSIPLTSPVDSSTRYNKEADPDAWYWAAIEKYKDNPEAYAYLSQNPYLRANNPFSPSLGNQVMDLLGDTSAEDAYYNELQQKARDYLGQWERGQYEQKYESPVEQVKREEAAGINPALNPGMITPGEAAENDQPFSPTSMPGAGTGFETMQTLANFGLQFVGGILSFGKQIQELNIGSFNRVTSELGAGSGAGEFVLNELSRMDFASLQKAADTGDFTTVLNPRIFSGYSRKTKQFLQHYIERYKEGDKLGYQTLVAELMNRKLRANQDSANIKSSPYFDDDMNVWASNIMENYSKFVAAADKFTASAAASRAEVESTFYGNEATQNVLGETMSEELYARGDTARSTAASAKYKTEMENAWNELEKTVKGDGKHWYNTIGLILLNFLRAQVSQPLHMGFSSSSSLSDSYGKNSTFHSSSQSSGFHF